MFIKSIIKTDKTTGKQYNYYRLCEGYRIGSKVRHKAIVTIGRLDEITDLSERKLLADRIEELFKGIGNIFESHTPPHIEKLARKIVKKISDTDYNKTKPTVEEQKKDLQTVDLNSLKNEDIREIGSEWLCKQAIEELGINEYLSSCGWDKEMISNSLIHIISKAVFPASENKTEQWIDINSGVTELFEKTPKEINRFKLYKSALKLYNYKDNLEEYLANKTNEIFDIDDKIILYDLTNSYFEGRKVNSKIARFGRSKEKRSDCKLVTLALVVNSYGFVKHSKILEGNIADCKTMTGLIEELSSKTSFSERKPVVVIDAGIATEDNLKTLKENKYDYLCVSRCRLKNYQVISSEPVTIYDNRKHIIKVQLISNQSDTDTYLHVHSQQKEIKERSMQDQFNLRFEEELKNIAESILKKNGTKKYDKVLERIGRIKERYPAGNKNYVIEVLHDNDNVTQINWHRKDIKKPSGEGEYFIRTTLHGSDEKQIWNIYNNIREIEASFRTLKTDLNLRPVFHQFDKNTIAHLFLGVLAYVVVSLIRYRLKQKGIDYDWKNIIRIMNTQKLVSNCITDKDGRQICIRKVSVPIVQVAEIYQAMNYKMMPLYSRKFVVPEK
jgi:hypothetical protein